MAAMETLSINDIIRADGEDILPLQQQASVNLPARPTTNGASVEVLNKKEAIKSLKVPILEKGSGQDRFRKMITGPAPFSDITNSASSLVANGQNQGNFYSSAGPMYGPFHSSFQQDMYPENHPSEYRSIAINPSFYPRAASLARQRSQSPIPMPHGAATRDRNGKDWVHDRYNGPINVGSQGGPTLGQTWTSQLSAECQKRHFNPQFKEWINSDGTFQCSVELRGITLNDSRTWRSAVDAKQALARRAVEHIRKTPVIGVSNRERERAQVKAEEKARSQTKSQTVAAEQEEERRLLTKVQRLYGTGPGPSENILGNPVASRAFLEGFALGSKLRDSVRNQRRRSRSPPHSDRGRDRRGSYDGYIKRE